MGIIVVTVRDLASVHRTFEDRETYARLNGEPATSALEVKKRTGENIVEDGQLPISSGVEQERKEGLAGRDYEYDFLQETTPKMIRNMLTIDLQNNVSSAVLLVMLIIVAALGVRTKVSSVGVAIPGSPFPDRYSGARRHSVLRSTSSCCSL